MPLDVTKGSITLDYAEKVAAGALAEDVVGASAQSNCTIANFYGRVANVGPGSYASIANKSLTYDAASMTVAVGSASIRSAVVDESMKLRLYMDGVQMAESGWYDNALGITYVLVATKALSGSKTCEIRVWNYDVGAQDAYIGGGYGSGSKDTAIIGVGSIKLV